ncbi:proline--tRNA ligase [Candidatus Saccharibacteria bacterium]|nr:proline--tRNA ligase [Candidatus Saccharibacteria bacterium]
MRYSKIFGRTSKTEGAKYTIKSHKLLTQAGFIRESTAGRYYFLPLGLKVHNKVVDIVRKHMNKADAQEMMTPVLHPLGLWQETNRTDTAGFELMVMKDRRDASFALGGTAEEMMVDVVRNFNISYKDLPFNIYQFSMKFRDELRSRGGLLRVREFVMKDAYSFGTEDQFKKTYQQMWKAYQAIFDELGLKVDVIEADNGYIGGEYSHEFVAESEIGESTYFVTEDGSYKAHEDVAQFVFETQQSDEEIKPLQEVEGKKIIGVEMLAKHLGIKTTDTTKTILFESEQGDVVAAAIGGEYEVNKTKLESIIGGSPLTLASAETVKRVTGAEVGYAGVLNLPKEVRVVMDESMKGRKNFEMGANKTDFHTINVNFGRDIDEPDEFHDIKLAKAGMKAPNGKILIEKKGIEVGNIFQLGYHYSKLMEGATYTDEKGEQQPYYMGCYGFGIGRTMAAIAEIFADDKGLVWQENIAPAQVFLLSIGNDETVINAADELYRQLKDRNIEVIYDDRKLRPGEKFADADLIGVPHRVVISPKTVEANKVEYKHRTSSENQLLGLDELFEKVS